MCGTKTSAGHPAEGLGRERGKKKALPPSTYIQSTRWGFAVCKGKAALWGIKEGMDALTELLGQPKVGELLGCGYPPLPVPGEDGQGEDIWNMA